VQDRDENYELTLLIQGRTTAMRWFYWIALLSAINSALELVGTPIHFLAGLGITQFVDAVARAMADQTAGAAGMSGIRIAAFVFDLVVAGFFLLAGRRSIAGARGFAIAGLLLYVADTFIMVFFRDWFSVLFHAWAGYSIWRGLQADAAIRRVESNLAEARPPAPVESSRPIV
jgi:multisubunit Na+/H+ antiporter MnhG subunit